ncbi:hypothetical protein SAMN04488136_11698 [Vibrio xiamenensis]|uniref:Uncharacterized protein n=1 Tax=Vibrio xiamenensis TaxID=861298 RepID=A0A1G8CK08_9VIBR|nr:hypothetical protein [Vibrio xiamenensis]SDH45543.1 hypothetical protein SAMN04488136_11698 [Vibrio xiamenensis]
MVITRKIESMLNRYFKENKVIAENKSLSQLENFLKKTFGVESAILLSDCYFWLEVSSYQEVLRVTMELKNIGYRNIRATKDDELDELYYIKVKTKTCSYSESKMYRRIKPSLGSFDDSIVDVTSSDEVCWVTLDSESRLKALTTKISSLGYSVKRVYDSLVTYTIIVH